MSNISRRAFLTGSAATAALAAPLTPGLVTWFERWYNSRKFWSFANPKPFLEPIDCVDPGYDELHRRIQRAIENAFPPSDKLSLTENMTRAFGQELSKTIQGVTDAGLTIDAKIIDAKNGIVEFELPLAAYK